MGQPSIEKTTEWVYGRRPTLGGESPTRALDQRSSGASSPPVNLMHLQLGGQLQLLCRMRYELPLHPVRSAAVSELMCTGAPGGLGPRRSRTLSGSSGVSPEGSFSRPSGNSLQAQRPCMVCVQLPACRQTCVLLPLLLLRLCPAADWAKPGHASALRHSHILTMQARPSLSTDKAPPTSPRAVGLAS